MNTKPINEYEFGEVVGLKSGIKGAIIARNEKTGEFFLEYGKGGRIQSFTKDEVLYTKEAESE